MDGEDFKLNGRYASLRRTLGGPMGAEWMVHDYDNEDKKWYIHLDNAIGAFNAIENRAKMMTEEAARAVEVELERIRQKLDRNERYGTW